MIDCTLFFVKYPMPGQVKTRLGQASTPELAAEFYATFVEEKLAEFDGAVQSDLFIMHSPEKAGQAMADWLGKEHNFIGQKGPNLGRRMENAFREIFFMGYDRAVLVGSDIPGLTPEIINLALVGLTPERAALGPSGDGGYYLVGFHRDGFVPEIFHTDVWSVSDVFQRAHGGLVSAGKQLVDLPVLEDLDTLEDVETMVALGGLGPLGGRSLESARRLLGK